MASVADNSPILATFYNNWTQNLGPTERLPIKLDFFDTEKIECADCKVPINLHRNVCRIWTAALLQSVWQLWATDLVLFSQQSQGQPSSPMATTLPLPGSPSRKVLCSARPGTLSFGGYTSGLEILSQHHSLSQSRC